LPACILLWLRQRRRRHVQLQPNNGELSTATGDFSDENWLRRGGFGNIYLGNMKGDNGGDGKQVIVKFSSET
jgi:hypothetical protein